MKQLPRLVITGASGFIGRNLLDGLKETHQIFAMARRSQARSNSPVHDNIRWIQVDIRHRQLVGEAFRQVKEAGGAEYVLHLAAHYDFTGEEHPDYQRTNIDGLRNVLDESKDLNLKRFIFASSIAACDYPPEDSALTEMSPPNGLHHYAVSKARGEAMLKDYDETVPSCIARFAALFSDWCEYPPMYFFLETWLTRSWNSRVIGGHGTTAIPYLHVREMTPFIRAIMELSDKLRQREVLLASPNATISHHELFYLVHQYNGTPNCKPVFMPKPLCAIGIPVRDILGRLAGKRPFERGWMVAHIDKDLFANPSVTWNRLSWKPRGRLLICRRLPFLLEHRKTDAVEWTQRNEAAMKAPWVRPNLLMHKLLEVHMDEVRKNMIQQVIEPDFPHGFMSYRKIPKGVFDWRVTVIYRQLLNAIRTNERGVFTDYCKDLAIRRHAEGHPVSEVVQAVRLIQANILRVLNDDPAAIQLLPSFERQLDMTIAFGCDQIFETYEELGAEVPDTDDCEGPLSRFGFPVD